MTTEASEFSNENNIAIALRELGRGCEEVAAVLERGGRIEEVTISEVELATKEIVGNLRTLIGEYPRGKLNESDEGQINVRFGVKDGTVLVHFGKPIVWIGLGSHDARAWSKKLSELADKVEQ